MKIKCLELGLNSLYEYVDRLDIGTNTFDDLENDIHGCLIHSIRELYVICQNAEHGNFPTNHVSVGLERAMENVQFITDKGIDIVITNKRGYNNRCRVAFLVLLGLIQVYFDLKKTTNKEYKNNSELDVNLRRRIYEMTDEQLLEMNFKQELETLYFALIGKGKVQNPTSNCGKFPKELDNPKAKEVLQRGIKANLLDENYQLLKGVTQGQAYLFALYASQELRIYNQWQVFGVSLWGIKNLGRVKLESTRDEKLDVVRGLFSEKIIRDAMTK